MNKIIPQTTFTTVIGEKSRTMFKSIEYLFDEKSLKILMGIGNKKHPREYYFLTEQEYKDKNTNLFEGKIELQLLEEKLIAKEKELDIRSKQLDILEKKLLNQQKPNKKK